MLLSWIAFAARFGVRVCRGRRRDGFCGAKNTADHEFRCGSHFTASAAPARAWHTVHVLRHLSSMLVCPVSSRWLSPCLAFRPLWLRRLNLKPTTHAPPTLPRTTRPPLQASSLRTRCPCQCTGTMTCQPSSRCTVLVCSNPKRGRPCHTAYCCRLILARGHCPPPTHPPTHSTTHSPTQRTHHRHCPPPRRDFGAIRDYQAPKERHPGSIMSLSNTGGHGRGDQKGRIIGDGAV